MSLELTILVALLRARDPKMQLLEAIQKPIIGPRLPCSAVFSSQCTSLLWQTISGCTCAPPRPPPNE
jgi:hypothetical protein